MQCGHSHSDLPKQFTKENMMAIIRWLDTDVVGFTGELSLSVNNRHTKAVYNDEEGGAKIILQGRDLKVDGGVLQSGTARSATFEDSNGDPVIAVTSGRWKAAQLGEAAENGDPADLLRALCKGDDKVLGTSGNDVMIGLTGDDVIRGRGGMDSIVGGSGDDIIVGGADSDVFIFLPDEAGHDVIRDFDVIGEETDTFKLNQDITVAKAIHQGEDTLIALENGATILLENVTKRQFDEYWFNLT
jgi:Ca2+-binding RTX toxin-like protein